MYKPKVKTVLRCWKIAKRHKIFCSKFLCVDIQESTHQPVLGGHWGNKSLNMLVGWKTMSYLSLPPNSLFWRLWLHVLRVFGE